MTNARALSTLALDIAQSGILFASDFGVSVSNSDNGPALQNFLSAVCGANCIGILPNGLLSVSTPITVSYTAPLTIGSAAGMSLTLIGAGSALPSGAGTYIYWGSGSPINTSVFSGYIAAAGNTLTVTSVSSGVIGLGTSLMSTATGFMPGTGIYLTNSGSGTGGTGTYTLNTYYASAVGSSGSPVTFNIPTPMFSFIGIQKLNMTGMGITGSAIVGDVMMINQGSGPAGVFGYDFKDVNVMNPADNCSGFRVIGSIDTARFVFTSCEFASAYGTTSIGFYIDGNGNSLNHCFIGCGFNGGSYGMVFNGGTASLDACEFSGAGIADILMTGGCQGITLRRCWTEQSKRFIVAHSPATGLTLDLCQIASYPWSYYYVYGNGSVPPNTQDSFVPIRYDAPSSMVIINSRFVDPSNGSMSGTFTFPLAVQNQNYGVGVPWRWTNIGSLADTGTGGAPVDILFLDVAGVHVPSTNWSGPTTTTAPSAGGAGALPATPTGFVTIAVNGVNRQSPYY